MSAVAAPAWNALAEAASQPAASAAVNIAPSVLPSLKLIPLTPARRGASAKRRFVIADLVVDGFVRGPANRFGVWSEMDARHPRREPSGLGGQAVVGASIDQQLACPLGDCGDGERRIDSQRGGDRRGVDAEESRVVEDLVPVVDH